MVVAWDVLNSLETLIELAGGEFQGRPACGGVGSGGCLAADHRPEAGGAGGLRRSTSASRLATLMGLVM